VGHKEILPKDKGIVGYCQGLAFGGWDAKGGCQLFLGGSIDLLLTEKVAKFQHHNGLGLPVKTLGFRFRARNHFQTMAVISYS